MIDDLSLTLLLGCVCVCLYVCGIYLVLLSQKYYTYEERCGPIFDCCLDSLTVWDPVGLSETLF